MSWAGRLPSSATCHFLLHNSSSHARTSRSHSLRWPRRLFLKTYRLFIFAQIHDAMRPGPHAWRGSSSGKYGGNVSALLGIKHDRHRNVACGGWWGPFMAHSLELTGQAGFRDTRGPTACQPGPGPSTILNTPAYSIRLPPSTSAQSFSSIQSFARFITIQEIISSSYIVLLSLIRNMNMYYLVTSQGKDYFKLRYVYLCDLFELS